jgi:Do/DeqQ family serine protease
MKKYTGIILVAILSSVFTLIAYTFVLKNTQKNEAKNIEKVVSDTTTFSHLINTANSAEAIMNKSLPNFKNVVKHAKSAVVHVRNTRFVQQFYPYYYGYNRAQVQKQEGTGSGVIISPDGYIVTNNHVIKGASELSVTLDNNKTYTAELIGTDPNSDIAIIKIDATDLPYMTFGNSDRLSLGEWVLAIGNPYNIGTTVTAGIVSAKARDLKGNKRIDNFIQTDAAVNPGNSGGALLNATGELIGINTMIFSMNGSFIGYSFAIPSNVVKKIVDDILEYGSIQKGVLGIKAAELNDDIAKKLNIDTSEGVYIYGVEDNEDEQSTLQIGDIIIKIDDVKVATMADLLGYLRSKRPGDKIEVLVLRDGDQETVISTLRKNNAAYLKSLGLSVKNVAQKILKKYGVSNGVYIDRVNNRLLYQNGITPGYIITKINDADIHSVDDITSMLDQLDNQRYTIEIVSPEGRVEKYIFR